MLLLTVQNDSIPKFFRSASCLTIDSFLNKWDTPYIVVGIGPEKSDTEKSIRQTIRAVPLN
jgi:hypothetical protein